MISSKSWFPRLALNSCCSDSLPAGSSASSSRCAHKAGDLGGPHPALFLRPTGSVPEGSSPVPHTPLIPQHTFQMRPTTRAPRWRSKFHPSRMQQCHFLEVPLPEVQLQGLADPMDISLNSPGFWAETGSQSFICSGAFALNYFLERPFSVTSKAPKVLVSSLCVKQ